MTEPQYVYYLELIRHEAQPEIAAKIARGEYKDLIEKGESRDIVRKAAACALKTWKQIREYA